MTRVPYYRRLTDVIMFQLTYFGNRIIPSIEDTVTAIAALYELMSWQNSIIITVGEFDF